MKTLPTLMIEYTAPAGEKNERRISLAGGRATTDSIEFRLECENGIHTPYFVSETDICLRSISIEYPLPEGFCDKDPDFYGDMHCTNDMTQAGKLASVKEVCSRTLVMTKAPSEENACGIGFVTAHRFYAYITLTSDGFTVFYDLEDKPLVPGEEYRLEKYLICDEVTESFLERYASAIASENGIRPIDYLPTGFCSWSCYYADVDERKITGAAEQLDRFAPGKANLVQIDDGWQKSRSFSGEWEHNPERFPNGIAPLADKVHGLGMKFGLWLAPMLLDKNSEYFEDLKHMARLDTEPLPCIHAFDLDCPEFYTHLTRVFRRMVEEYRSDYFKLDFLDGSLGKMGAPKKDVIKYKSDYCVALFRRAMQTIRDAVGDDVTLLSCGCPILETAGIFNAQRVSCDIIWGKSHELPNYWTVMKSVVATTFHRNFYNKTVLVNDPDGLVIRDFDNGDGFNCTYSEAQLWATAIALSGGSVLHNEELENLSPARRDLFLRQLPPLGVTGRPVDYFEENPSAVVADYDDNTRFVALFNYEDGYRDMSLPLSRIGIEKAMVFDCAKGEYKGIIEELCASVMNPHSATLFMIKKVPTEPTFLFSTGNLFLGQNLHDSSYDGGKLIINGDAVNGERIYAYYPDGTVLEKGGSEIKTDNGYIVLMNN